MGDHLGMMVRLMGCEDPADSTEGIQRGVWPQNPAYGGAKISGDPAHSVCLQDVLVVPLLVSILRGDPGAHGIKSD